MGFNLFLIKIQNIHYVLCVVCEWHIVGAIESTMAVFHKG